MKFVYRANKNRKICSYLSSKTGLPDTIHTSMLANFSDIHGESIFSRHKFPFHFQKFDKGIYVHLETVTYVTKLHIIHWKLKTTISLCVPILKGGPQRDNPEDTYTWLFPHWR